ncbi:YbaY family lipoprotein [Pseudomonas vanderleydeniana]|uniref:YbaY family lipoprotein n=1 Tax=Pseudomonas vanderleydeniana TaxID=2745495 RepID=A0A9E6PJV5_9PSED|nr:YbaY family lipoprotein [Pseudomonas vanderleydeniana]QXI27904.1 YbaY family lipoprotein [Pseudomonas vanderleydeniana]
MSVRPLVLLSLTGLLLACSSAPKPVPTPPPQQQVKKPLSEYEALGPLPAYQRELSGTLQGVPANAEVELALLVIDERGRPQQLLASSRINGTGQVLPFRLRFNPDVFPATGRVELRGRASQSGQLILHLPSVTVSQPTTQAMGQLQFVSAP